MTPLMIEILLHYYSCARDYRNGDFSAPAVREAIDWFRGEAGMLNTHSVRDSDATYSLTDKGKFYVEYLLSIPIPVIRYAIELGV